MSEFDAETLTHDRFVLERRLGSGSTGTVYAAYDKKRDERVALKVLTYRSASALYRFKREFRTLADVVHPNLVAFFELVADEEDEAFFTMELIDGVNILDHVRPPKRASGAPVVREDRLRSAFRQLAEAVAALHDRDKIHCDLKPNNVLVDTAGRVVILDFGIARDLAPTLTPQSLYRGLSGTVPYMAPEQAKGGEPRPASDWYAMGVILFQALTGQLPFEGSLVEVLSAKVSKKAPSPSELAPEAPRDLAELCADLLEIEPERRPSGAEVLVRFGAEARRGEKGDGEDALKPIRSDLAALGRQDALEVLHDAFETSLLGQTVAVYVHGESGLGKSALVRHFLWELIETRGAVVLAGRCYEREHVPFKALDGVVDSLSRYLNQAAEIEVPADVDALCLLFPVLRRVSFLEEAARETEISDRLSLRRRGFSALRRLLAGLAEAHPLVVFIDDLHWADADSTVLVHELLRSREPFPLLLVASFRSEEIAVKPFLADLLRETESESSSPHPSAGRFREVRLGPLDDASAAELTRALLGDASEIEPLVAAIVREAEGSPFFVEQLVDYARATDSSLSSSIGLDELLDVRIAQLPEGTEELLRTLAAAGRPLATAVAYEAAGLSGDERPLIAALKAAHLVRTSGTADHIEIFHNRIRETLAERIDAAETRTIHARLVETLSDRGDDDPEALFEHLLHAGEKQRAAMEAARAAAKARRGLAFDRAARFFRRALDLGEFAEVERQSLLEGLAECLGYAGHAGDSARTYLELSRVSTGRDGERLQALRYRQRAAEEYMAAGYFAEGLEVVRDVGREVGLDLPSSSQGALTSIWWNRLRLRLRGLGFTRREAVDVPQEDLLRVDACWVMAASLTLNWPLHGSFIQTRHLLLALEAGEPLRLSRALNIESSFRVAGGAPPERTTGLRRTARELARGDPQAEGTCLLHEGIAAYAAGRWREGAEGCEKAEAYFKEKVAGGFSEILMAQRYGLPCRYYLGDFDVLCRRVPELVAEARERGNVLTQSELATRLHMAWLARDDPAGSRRSIDEALALRSREDFHLPHYNSFLGRCHADLYEGEGERALARLREEWPRLERSLLMRLRLVAHEAHSLRGRAALAAAAVEPRKDRLKLAARAAARLERGREPYARPMAALLRAGLAVLGGEAERGARILGQAARAFEAQEMGLYAAVARRRLGEILGGDEGGRIVAAAGTWMRERKIARPERMAAVLAPGFPGVRRA